MNGLSRLAGAVVLAIIAVGLRQASDVATVPYGEPDGLLRVAFRARPERIEVCREQTPEELARIPAHMRQAQICDGISASYRLEVLRDGRPISDDVVYGAGVRHDRPLYVFREFPQPAGDAEIAVRLTRREAAPPASANVVPERLTLERTITFVPRRVVLITYDTDRRELVVLGAGT